MTTKIKIPKIRFKEFEWEWEENKIEINIISWNTYPLSSYKKNWILLIQWLNINPGKIDIDKPIYISTDSNKNHIVVKKNDILLALNRPITNNKLKTSLFNKDIAYLYQRAWILNFDNNYINNIFLYQYISSENFMKKLSFELVWSDQPYIKSDLFKKTKNIFPQLPEQHKIASFLSNVDEKIENIREKKKNLEEYKKWIMQKIFSRELRFKDENWDEFEEWEEKDFNEIFESISTKNYQILNSEILDNWSYKVVDQWQNLISWYSNDKNKLFKNWPIIIFGDHTTILKYIDFEFIIWADWTKILKNKIWNLYFLYSFLEYNKIQPEWYKRHFSILKNLIISFPSLPEQQKIEDFLNWIDEKIEKVGEELEKMEEFKRGLLQGMFV